MLYDITLNIKTAYYDGGAGVSIIYKKREQ